MVRQIWAYSVCFNEVTTFIINQTLFPSKFIYSLIYVVTMNYRELYKSIDEFKQLCECEGVSMSDDTQGFGAH